MHVPVMPSTCTQDGCKGLGIIQLLQLRSCPARGGLIYHHKSKSATIKRCQHVFLHVTKLAKRRFLLPFHDVYLNSM